MSPHPRMLRLLERTLFGAAVVALGWYTFVSVESVTYQRLARHAVDRALEQRLSRDGGRPGGQAGAPVRNPDGSVPSRIPGEREATAADLPDALLGTLEIPRLNLSVAVRAGIDERTLRKAVGHIPGTARPGEDGNIGIAGHRDRHFRPLRQVRNGDEILLRTAEGSRRYRVLTAAVVSPEDTWVLMDTGRPSLTLVTCYPFDFIGSAPDRFIIKAARVD